MKKSIIEIILLLFLSATSVLAENVDNKSCQPDKSTMAESETNAPRLTIGGYGEAVYSRNFYSDSPYRYMFADRYKNAPGYGRADLPHVVINLGYNFGNGWTMGTEIEFEHGGVEVAMEVEGDEAVELEHEIERGGEVFLEQFWLQKSWNNSINLRAGMIIVPVGLTNSRHEPDGFFTVYRQEGESTILPCTWHQIGISLWGRTGDFRYEAQVIPGLNSRLFNNSGWIAGASASPYEYTVANTLAGAFRLDNYSIRNLRIGISGYVGGTSNDAYPRLVSSNGKVTTITDGTVLIGAVDFQYQGKHVTARGNADYGYLSNASAIGTSNKNSDNSTFSPYQHTFVGEKAYAVGVEAGLDIFSYIDRLKDKKFFVFGRYEAYDSYIPAKDVQDYKWSDRQRFAVGINYRPIDQIIVKAEFSHRMFRSQYNNEPSINIGITYSGFFKR